MATDVRGPVSAPPRNTPDGPPQEAERGWGKVTTPRTLLSRALSVPLALGFTVFLPLFVASQSGAGTRDAAFWLQLALTMYAGARLSAMVLTSRRKLLQGSFWLFVYMAMGVAPLAQAVLGQVPTPSSARAPTSPWPSAWCCWAVPPSTSGCCSPATGPRDARAVRRASPARS